MGPKKYLGQHFLTEPAYAQQIADAVPAGANDNVLEIGPGRGALSVFLKERFPSLHLVEIDNDVISGLSQKLGPGKFTIHEADVLEFDFATAGFPLHVVGNLPYSIGALIIKKTLLHGKLISSFTFMVQLEVAERIVSPPHRKTNGFLSIFCQYFGPATMLFKVPPGAFFPKPKVDSAVVQIIPDEAAFQRLPEEEWEMFFAFVSRGFLHRRKKLSNVLGENPADRERYESALSGLGLNPLSRPEDLGIAEWLALFRTGLP